MMMTTTTITTPFQKLPTNQRKKETGSFICFNLGTISLFFFLPSEIYSQKNFHVTIFNGNSLSHAEKRKATERIPSKLTHLGRPCCLKAVDWNLSESWGLKPICPLLRSMGFGRTRRGGKKSSCLQAKASFDSVSESGLSLKRTQHRVSAVCNHCLPKALIFLAPGCGCDLLGPC